MGQTSSTQPCSSTLLIEHNIPEADYGTLSDSKEMEYTCKLCSSKTNADIHCTSKTSVSAHGTRFVYFSVTKAISLSDYNTIICGLDHSSLPGVCFETSSLHYDTKIVHKGADYNQFVTTLNTNTHGRLLARTLHKKSDKEETHVELLDDKTRLWNLVWEIHVNSAA